METYLSIILCVALTAMTIGIVAVVFVVLKDIWDDF